MLRFGPNGAVVEADGGRPTSRGLPACGVLGTGRRGKTEGVPQKGILKGLDP